MPFYISALTATYQRLPHQHFIPCCTMLVKPWKNACSLICCWERLIGLECFQSVSLFTSKRCRDCHLPRLPTLNLTNIRKSISNADWRLITTVYLWQLRIVHSECNAHFYKTLKLCIPHSIESFDRTRFIATEAAKQAYVHAYSNNTHANACLSSSTSCQMLRWWACHWTLSDGLIGRHYLSCAHT